MKNKGLLIVSALVSMLVVACGGRGGSSSSEAPAVEAAGWKDPKHYTYNDYTTITPSNWNMLTYQDNNDTAIMNYVHSSLFGFDYKFEEDGSIASGEFEVVYEGAEKLEDVTAEYAGQFGIDEKATSLRAYKITLRSDLKWDDGTRITAHDFVYSMKEQLNPLFKNYRADSYYNSAQVIHNAREYVYQGETVFADNYSTREISSVADLSKGADGVYEFNGSPVSFAIAAPTAYLDGDPLTAYAGSLHYDSILALYQMSDENGFVPVTDETIALLTTAISTPDWQEDASYLPVYMHYNKTYPEMDFSEVGYFVGENDTELVMCLDKGLALLKEDGSLSYQAAYQMSSLPLVKQDVYEAHKIAPREGESLWTTDYSTSVESTPSWGPYKLTSFQAGKEFVLERNENWYGYQDGLNDGKYQVDKIVTTCLPDWNTAWLSFQAGNVDGIGIDVSIAPDYKNSDRAYFTPDDYVASLQLQSSKEALANREEDGINKTILADVDFRKALSLGIDREALTQKCTTSSKPGFGLFNSMHYYDVENGGVYRNQDLAKQVLCDVYSVDPADYPNLDAAEAAITGYDVAEARRLMTAAYDRMSASGKIAATDKVKLTFGTGSITESTTRLVNTIGEMWEALAVGTPLEGKIELELKDFGSSWANDFRSGGYDVCLGGWSGAAWDPGYFLLAYLSPAYMYSAAWDTSSHMLEFTMPGVGEDGADVKDTLSLIEWYYCLNGISGAKYDWSSGVIEEEKRLLLIAALEKEILSVYYTLPLYNFFSASLLSYKVDYISYDYNTFMGYGGITYMTFNYDDAGWAEFVAAQGGTLDYKG